jgi:hypothetical protein
MKQVTGNIPARITNDKSGDLSRSQDLRLNCIHRQFYPHLSA